MNWENVMDHRTEAFKSKFKDAARHLGVSPFQVVSLKLREPVGSYSEYREFLRVLEDQTGLQSSQVDGDLQGQGHLLLDGNARIILVEHETGLEILYIAGSIASLIGLIPLALHAWRTFRGRNAGRHHAGDRGVEIRRLDEKGHLSEEHIQDHPADDSGPFMANIAKILQSDLQRLVEQINGLTHRVESLEKQLRGKANLLKKPTKKRVQKKRSGTL